VIKCILSFKKNSIRDCMFQLTERPTYLNQMDLVVLWSIDGLTVIDCNMDYNMGTFLQLNSSPRGASMGITVCWSSLARRTCSKIMGTQKGYRIRIADQFGGTRTISIHYYTIWGDRGANYIVPRIGTRPVRSKCGQIADAWLAELRQVVFADAPEDIAAAGGWLRKGPWRR